ncbi:MAG: FAD-dependent oxidoreductase [Kiritimatiellae bacterium]|nr:FAD-dependent oxidoreductase [Kiritimatiellia bacterium]
MPTKIKRRAFLGGSLAATLAVSPAAGDDHTSPRRKLSAGVCVVGGGPAGFTAAIAAARQGAKVMLVESFGFPGGMATAGLVGPISKFNFGGKRVVGGIPWEFVERLADRGGAITDLPKGNVPFEAEIYRRVAREMLEEAGVTCLWQTSVCGAPELARDASIRAVTLSTAGFLSRLEADMFIDCSASGALVGHHGFGSFRSARGAAQPLSLCFHLGGIDTAKARVLVRHDNERSANPVLRAALEAAMKAGRIRSFGGPWAVWGSTIRPGFVSVNATRATADVTDPVEIAEATALMRREIPEIVDVMRGADPAFREAYVSQTATASGFRECRELAAFHRVTATEFVSGERPADTIALAAHPMDRHLAGSSGQNLSFLKKPGAIPLSALISAKCPNLLAAGGLVAAEPAAFASIRVQAQCMATGQAAGTAAAMSAKAGRAPKDLDAATVVAALRQANVSTVSDNGMTFP